MSLTVAARHGAAALPVFSSCARANVRGLTSKYARHPARARHVRAVTVQTRAEMEYDYDIFTIGACPLERFSTSSASVSARAPRRTLKKTAATRARGAATPSSRRFETIADETRFFSDKKRTLRALEVRFSFSQTKTAAEAFFPTPPDRAIPF
jgi:hypothetical protein